MENKKRTNWFTNLFVTALLIGIPGTTLAADLNEFLLKFQPYISMQEEYSDNLNLTSKDKKGGYITSIFSGFSYSTLPKSEGGGIVGDIFKTEEKSGIDLAGQVGYVSYNTSGNYSNYLSLNGSLNAWYTWANRLTLRLTEYIIRSDDAWETPYPGASPAPPSSGNEEPLTYLPGTQRQRSVWFRNVVSPTVEYQFSEMGQVSLNYRNNVYFNDNPLSEDSQENFFSPKLTYWFDIRNGMSLQYGYDIGNFDTSSDFTGHTVTGQYIHRFNPYTSITASYTYSKKNFDQHIFDYDVNSGTFGIDHQFSPTLSGRLSVGYFWESPERGESLSGPVCDISLSQRAEKTTYTLLLQGGYQENFFTAENLGVTQYYRAAAVVTRQLMERLSARLLGGVEWEKSRPSGNPLLTLLTSATRKDTLWKMEGNVSYQLLKWLTLSTNLTYRVDNSNVPTLDYNEFRAVFRVEAKYH